MTEKELRSKVCAQAKAWLGRNEADGSHREIIDLYNAGREPGSYAMSYTDPWCAAFVSAVGMAAGLWDVIVPHVNCDGMIAAYQAKGLWIEDDAYDPAPGDLVFYDWDDSGIGDNRGSADHVGIVLDADGKLLTVIEGNYSDSVKQRYIYEDGSFIRGFAVPDYARKASETPAEATQTPDTPLPVSTPSEPAEGKNAAQTGAVCSVSLPLLRYGDKSEAVRNAQRLLIAHGHFCGGQINYNGKELPDGEFGPVTCDAVKFFQSGAGLTADGVVGAETWAALINA